MLLLCYEADVMSGVGLVCSEECCLGSTFHLALTGVVTVDCNFDETLECAYCDSFPPDGVCILECPYTSIIEV